MVVPVQEDERLLAQHDQHRVTQLRHLRQHEHCRPETRHFVLLDEAGKKNRFFQNPLDVMDGLRER